MKKRRETLLSPYSATHDGNGDGYYSGDEECEGYQGGRDGSWEGIGFGDIASAYRADGAGTRSYEDSWILPGWSNCTGGYA